MLVPLAVGAVALSACGSWRDEDAATVDGATISMSELRDEVDVLVAHPDVASAFQVDVSEGEAATERSATLVAWLNRRITDLAMEEELARRGLAVGEAALANAEAELRFQLELYGRQAAQSGQAVAPLDQFDQLPDDLRADLVRREATREVLAAAVAADGGEPLPASAEAWFDANQASYERYCVSIIMSADEQASNALLRRVRSGEDFAAIATTESLDAATAANGGDADCALATQLPDELAADLAAVEAGEVVGPVELASGWFLVKLNSSEPPNLDEAMTAVRVDRLTARQTALAGWVDQASPAVTVTPRLGAWNAEQFQVDALTGPAQAAAR